MPKSRESIEKLRQIRIQASKQKAQTPPSEIYLCVLGNAAPGSPRCLYMFTDHSRYLFNVGEGTQRLAHEYKMKLSKLEHIFITHNSWENMGGLLGLSLTIQDIGVPQVTIHGPQNAEDIYTYSKSFVVTKGLAINKRNPGDAFFTDNCLQIEYVPIFSSKTSCSCQFTVDSNIGEKQAEKRAKIIAVPDVMAYICKGHSKKGQLILKKCTELGVPPGPLLGELKSGNDVVLSSGKIVHSSDVVSPDEPCPVFLVVECPTEAHIDAFVSEQKLLVCQRAESNSAAALVVHFTPASILHTPKYQSWMDGFPDSTCHLILNEDSPTPNSVAIDRVQYMLNLLHPGIYPLIHENIRQRSSITPSSVTAQAKSLCRYNIRPNKGLDNCGVEIQPQVYIQEAMSTPGFQESLQSLQTKLQENCATFEGKNYPEVVFLGTGSCIPSKVRNVSGILLNISSECRMVLDCGEGTYNQLLRLHGHKDTEDILRKIKCVFISHLHADHHLGLFTLLKKRNDAFVVIGQKCTPLTVIAPHCIGNWLHNYDEKFECISSFYRFIDCSVFEFNRPHTSGDVIDAQLAKNFESTEILTVPVVHCPDAYGIVLNSANNWKIVYSGDTIPCQTLVDAGKDCTLLIHEATMEDDLEDEAALKMHSTTSQAIDIAERMNAQFTILTHFSQRYAKVPMFSQSFHSRVGCAFDNMRIRMCDLPIVSLFIPTLQILFAENVEKLVDKNNKRKEKLKLESSSIELVNVQ